MRRLLPQLSWRTNPHPATSWMLAAAALVLLRPTTAAASPADFVFAEPNPGWVPALLGGQPLTDPEGDTPGARDIVGDNANPLLYVASDAAHVYLRMRLDSDPLQTATNFGPFGWGCFMDTDANPQTYEFSMLIDGVNNPDVIRFYKNTITATLDSPADEPDLPALSSVLSPLTAAVKHAETAAAPSNFGGTPDFFLDWVIDVAVATNAGFDPSKPVRYYCGSANNGTTIAADCSGGIAGGCPLTSQFSDPISCGPTGCGVCGDGELGGFETCDDGNLTNGDGCSSQCLAELGETCTVASQCASAFCDETNDTCACDQNSDCPAGQLCNTLAMPNACVAPGCGNGVLEAAESCDDGNLASGDGCNASCLRELNESCTLSGQCASGFCDPAGNVCACDGDLDCPAGLLCNTVLNPNVCAAAGCGNGVLEAGEGCDDNNLVAGDGCNSQCLRELGQPCPTSNSCASAFCDPAGNVCSCDANADCSGQDICNTSANPNVCVAPGCGNGVLEEGEACEDGNLTDGDGCSALCLREIGQACSTAAQCTSAFCDPADATCACDGDLDCPAGMLCNTIQNPNVCVLAGCGNGVLEAGEGCDDNNLLAGDGCSAQCLLELGQACLASNVCASAFCDPVGNVCSCDADADCSGQDICNTSANPNVCVAPGCGNAVLEEGEACEDGNLTDGDGCSALCLREIGQACSSAAQCKSAFCDPADATCACDAEADCPAGQQCNLALEPNECVPAGCGNGVPDPVEGCDDGNLLNGDGCNAQCLLENGELCGAAAACASAFCDPVAGTCECDDHADCAAGQLCNTSPEPNACVAAGCGNGVLEAGEGCDDGNVVAADGCNATCLLELGVSCTDSPLCASGFCDPAGATCTCDDASDCPAQQVCNTASAPHVCVPVSCGNSLLEAGEGCDDGNLLAGDGCNAACLLELGAGCNASGACASAYCDPTGSLCACDDDADCGAGRLCNTATNPNVCVASICGNAAVEADEGCDDGNAVAGDGCSTACAVEPDWTCVGSPSRCTLPDGAPPVGTPPLTGCADDSDCTEGRVCDGRTRTCVGCLTDADCSAGEACTAATQTCTAWDEALTGGGCSTGGAAPVREGLFFGLLGLLLVRTRRAMRQSR